MRTLIALTLLALTTTASGQDFPFDTFPGQQPGVPFVGNVDSGVWDDVTGTYVNVMFVDANGDGRFDYMGGSQAVVNLDSYHATGHWDDAPYFATQLDQDAFESAMAAVYIPEAVEGWTGNYEADGTTFMYVNQDAFNDIRWGHMQIGSVPEDCSPPPMTCALRSVDDKLCFIEVEKQIRQAMRLNKDCIVVIVPRNSDLRVVPPSGGAADKTPFECNGTQYEAWIVCGLSNPSPLGHRPVQRKRQNGMWEALPFVPLKYGGTFYAVDKNGNWMTPGRRAMYWGGMWAPLSSYGAEASRFELCDFAKLYNSAYCTKSGRWDWMD